MTSITLKSCMLQLRDNNHAICGLCSQIDDESAVWKPAEDRWSVLEIINHLLDIEREDFRTEADSILNEPERPWPSFDINAWVTSRKYNTRDIAESVADFRREREKSIAWLESIADPDLDLRHSGNGFSREPMRLGDVLSAWVGHDFAHIRQLALIRFEILDRFGAPYSPGYSGFTPPGLPGAAAI